METWVGHAALAAGLALLVAIVVLAIFVNCSTKRVRAEDVPTYLWQSWRNRGPAYTLPAQLQGVWYMQNNPADELCVTFDGTQFDPEKKVMVGMISGGPYNWSFGASFLGRALYTILRPYGHMDIYFNQELTYGYIAQYILGVIQIPDWIMKFEMLATEDVNFWIRRSTMFCCIVGDYNLRRVMDGSGQKLPAYDTMVQDIKCGAAPWANPEQFVPAWLPWETPHRRFTQPDIEDTSDGAADRKLLLGA